MQVVCTKSVSIRAEIFSIAGASQLRACSLYYSDGAMDDATTTTTEAYSRPDSRARAVRPPSFSRRGTTLFSIRSVLIARGVCAYSREEGKAMRKREE